MASYVSMVIGAAMIGIGGVGVAPIGGVVLVMGARGYRASISPPRSLWRVVFVALGILAVVLLVEGCAILAWRYFRR
jgi:hypothetical protein